MSALLPALMTCSALALALAPVSAQGETCLELSRRPDSLLWAGAEAARRSLDPGCALDMSRALLLRARDRRAEERAWLELGKSWLLAGEATIALRYADALLRRDADSEPGLALRIRALLRLGRSREALRVAENGLDFAREQSFELRSAYASALYRNQRMREAQRSYRALLRERPQDSEALIRLGSGLLPAGPAPIHRDLRVAIEQVRDGLTSVAERSLLRIIHKQPTHPVPLRLLGELALRAERLRSPLLQQGLGDRLWARLAPAQRPSARVRAFLPAIDKVSEARRVVLERAGYYFEPWLGDLALRGAGHDILLEDERSTDARARRFLRGKRTFDGRLWDDVRGMGGLVAATGVEALDESRELGFDTLIHELAHQVHLYAMSRAERMQVTLLYRQARSRGRWLDKYSASHETEYFAQACEAFFSFAKCAGQPKTHGHTRFELARVDPAMHSFLDGLFVRDPLKGPQRRHLLNLALQAALLTGHCEDARDIGRMLGRSRAPRKSKLLRLEQRYRSL
ncbi:MAG: hypothetical protein CSA62_12005 [Planctomycetota bacterium]|nr:MAG: hypothetical protein CSA62_12005 [Planctomycetota bacterium]